MKIEIISPVDVNNDSDCARLSTYFVLVNFRLLENYPSLEEIRTSFGLDANEATPTHLVVQKLLESGADIEYFSSIPYEILSRLSDEELRELSAQYDARGNFSWEQLKNQIRYFSVNDRVDKGLSDMKNTELIDFFEQKIHGDQSMILMQININHSVVVFDSFEKNNVKYVSYYDPNYSDGPVIMEWEQFLNKKWSRDLVIGDFNIKMREAIIVKKSASKVTA